jgi:hypothetical protein
MTRDIDKIDETIDETERVLERFEGRDRGRDAGGDGEPDTAPAGDAVDEGAPERPPEAGETPPNADPDGHPMDWVEAHSEPHSAPDEDGSRGDRARELVDASSDRAFTIGQRAGDWLRDTVAAGTVRFLTGFGSVVPFRTRLMRKLLYRSMWKYHKFSGGDALGLRARPNGQIEPTPVKWQSALRPVDEVDDGSPSLPGWKVKGEERAFGAGPEGRNVEWLGRTPVILLDDDNPERWETLDARIADALEDPDRVDAVFEDATIEVTGIIDQRPRAADPDGGGAAVADGGSAQVEDHYSILFGDIARGRLKDKAIDVSSPDALDGMRVSWRKVCEMRHESTTTEEMHNQEVRGFLAGKAGGNHEELVKRLALYFILGVLGLLAIIFLGPPLVSGESVLPSLTLLPGWGV